jgi:hypothetical protein
MMDNKIMKLTDKQKILVSLMVSLYEEGLDPLSLIDNKSVFKSLHKKKGLLSLIKLGLDLFIMKEWIITEQLYF